MQNVIRKDINPWMNFMGIGNLELLLVLILALLILGPRRLILLAQVLGKFIGNLRGITETLPQYAEEFLEEDQNSKKPIM